MRFNYGGFAAIGILLTSNMENKHNPLDGYELVKEGKIAIDWIYFSFERWVYVGSDKAFNGKDAKDFPEFAFAKKKFP